MKDLTVIVCLFLLIICPLFFAADAFGQIPEDPKEETLESLLDELQQTIDEADKRTIAHLRFLEELRDMVKRYRAKLRKLFLFEDFTDGNYDRNPIKIIRQRGSRQFIIETATQYPDLDDGVPHRLQWIRDARGNMRVEDCFRSSSSSSFS